MDDLQKQTCIAMVNIFESSSVKGNYGAIGGLKNDAGHISYGRSQVSLSSGNLYFLIKAYCEATDAQFGPELSAFLTRLSKRDISLDSDAEFKILLKHAGDDPAMHREQDEYLDRKYFQPAMASAKAAGLQRALSQAIVYDTHIQGSWGACSQAVNQALGRIGGTVTEDQWIARYLEVRAAFLEKNTHPSTAYRPQAYGKLLAVSNWTLTLPFSFRNVAITEQSFGPPPPRVPMVPVSAIPDPEVDNLPILRPQIPYMRGQDVLNLQKLLNAAGMKNAEDKVYGPFTQALVSAFQKLKGLKPDAETGQQTWAALKAASAGN